MTYLEIRNICKSVDLYEAIKKPVDQSGQWDEFKSEGTDSGLGLLVKAVDNILDAYPSIKSSDVNYFFEFSILPTVLDSQSPDELECFSFLRGDEQFERLFTPSPDSKSSPYEQVITNTLETKNITIFHHPNFLFDIWNSGSEPLTVTNIGAKGQRKIGKRTNKARTIMMKRSYSETIEISKKFYSSSEFRRIEDVQKDLHEDIFSKIENTENTYFISFPIVGAKSDNQLLQYKVTSPSDLSHVPMQGVGAFFLYIESNLFNDEMIKNIGESLFDSIGELGRIFSINYLFNLGLRLQENARKEALRSAKAAIMSRNMSHNLGSHVMSYLKQHLSSVQSVLNDRILALLFESEADMLENLSEKLKEEIIDNKSEKGALPFLIGLGQFMSYLQERQDFIATIATDFIPYLSTVNFKDFIYDELNPDKRYERHKDRKNYKTDNILLGNIARSEGLGRPTSPTIILSKEESNKIKEESKLNDIIIKFRSFDGNPVKDPSGNIINSNGNDALMHMRDYDVSLPGGVVGRQAIFSIVENTIRNAAKHGNWRVKGKLELTFDIFTKDELLIYKKIKQLEIEIEQKKAKCENFEDLEELKNNKLNKLESTHHSIISSLEDKGNSNCLSLWEVYEKFYLEAKDSGDLYFITLTDNLSTTDDKLEKLRMAIYEPLVNERGEMNEASKGIKEMRISSTWLRGLNEGEAYNPIKYDEKNNSKLKLEKEWIETNKEQNAPSLYARISRQDDEEHLQYIFCVLRPKKVAIISSKFPQKNDSQKDTLDELYNKDAFLRNSWSAFHPKDYLKEKNKSYEFIIYDAPQDKKESYWYDLRYVSSSRLLKLTDTPMSEDLFENIKRSFDNNEEGLKAERDFYNGMLCSLYRHISNYDENEDFILIDDKKTSDRRINEDGFKPFKAITIIDSQLEEKERHKGQLDEIKTKEGTWGIYRTHHDSAQEFKNFVEEQDGKKFKQGVYVEGITGNNSTDRLVRNESLDEEWFCRHLHAMKTKIAIFDERLFTKIFGLEEADLNVVIKEDLDMKVLSSRYFKKYGINTIQEQKEWKSKNKNWKEIVEKEWECGRTQVPCNLKSVITAKAKTDYIPTSHSQKGIWVFTIIRDPQSPLKFNLYGIEKTEKNDFTKDYTSVCRKLAEFTWDDALKIKWIRKEEEDLFKNSFEHISVHQGLLDKLYTAYGIKDESSREQKEELTKRIFEEFSSVPQNEIAEVTIEKRLEEGEEERIVKVIDGNIELNSCNKKRVNHTTSSSFYLLPGMCIHSGRSKPSEYDMPQHLPFIQYASIENAILDCKYSLVELLDYARYE